MRRLFKKNSLFYQTIKCWSVICLKDKSLILIMFLLLIYCIYNLFMPAALTPTDTSIDVVFRSTLASIFGYFLSGNFLRREEVGDKPIPGTNLILPLNNKDTNNNNTDKDNSCIDTDNISSLKYYICNKTSQIMIAVSICIIAILALMIGKIFKIFTADPTPTIIQFRDIISSCIGFLLGHSNQKK